MPELSQTERLTIAAVVDGMQARTRSRRKAARQGWALLITGALAMPIIASALDGMITLPTALMRIVLAMAITMIVMGMAGSLFDSYQAQAATRTVESAVEEARKKVDETPENAAAATTMGGSGTGLNDGDGDDR